MLLVNITVLKKKKKKNKASAKLLAKMTLYELIHIPDMIQNGLIDKVKG